MRRIVIAVLLIAGMQADVSAAAGRRRAVRHPERPVVAPPVAAPDSYTVSAGTVLTIAAPGVLANDTINGASIASFGPSTGAEQTTLGSTAQTASGGLLSLAVEGGFTYTPSSAFNGTDAFRYVIRNDGGSSSAAVTIIVRAIETGAVGDSYTTAPESPLYVPAPGVLTNDALADGRIVSFGPQTGAEQTSLGGTALTARGGTISLGQDGSFSYGPPETVDDGYGYSRPFVGVDSFLYMVRIGSVSSTASVNVSVEVPSSGADYVVTTPGHYYAISGLSGENPPLQLTRGKTYKFQISVSPIHPFAILDAPAGSVTNNNITQGTLTFAVPLTGDYRYRCTTHLFGNVITTVP